MTNFLLFTSTTCVPCKLVKPTIHRVAVQKDVNVDDVVLQEGDNRAMFEAVGVTTVPTLVAMTNGREVGRLSGKFTSTAIGQFFAETQ